MRKKLLSCLLIASLCLALGTPITAHADGQKVVTLGADLTEDQKNAVLKYFGVLGQNVQTLIITNQDEREHLGSYVPLEQIGTKTFSCALVCPTSSGGIQVKTANLSWVTSNMIASTLSTAGVVNCDVLAASPFEVSGTGALTGVIMAYESASGAALDPVKKELATQEMIATTQIANNIGQQQATNIVNEIKLQVIEGAVVEPEEVEEIVEDVVEEIEYQDPEVMLSDEDRALLTGLMTQIAEQEYDYEEVKDTLQRVEENVNGITEVIDVLQQPEEEVTIEEDIEEVEEEIQPETLAPDSILMNTDDSALGSDVTIDATNQEALAETEPVPEISVDDEGDFEITTSDSYEDPGVNDETFVEIPIEIPETEIPIEIPETEVPIEIPEAEVPFEIPETEVPFEIPETEAPFEVPEAEVPVDQGSEVLDGTGMDDGVVIPEEGGEIIPEEVPVEIPVLELTNCDITPDSTDGSIEAAGINQIKLLYGNSDLVPTSGVLTIMDAFGNVCAAVDLTDKDQVRTAPISEEDKVVMEWSEGTQIIINLGTNLMPVQNYNAMLDGILAQTTDPAVTEGVPTAVISQTWTINTDSYGANVNIAKVTDIKAGAVLTGNVVMDETMAYATISSYDAEKLAFDVVDLSLEAPGFNMTCLDSGNAYFTVDYYDAEWNYLTSATITIMIP